jgi:hypothetical protein
LTLLTGKSRSPCSRMAHPSGSCTRHWSRTQGFSLSILTSWRKAPKSSSVKMPPFDSKSSRPSSRSPDQLLSRGGTCYFTSKMSLRNERSSASYFS